MIKCMSLQYNNNIMQKLLAVRVKRSTNVILWRIAPLAVCIWNSFVSRILQNKQKTQLFRGKCKTPRCGDDPIIPSSLEVIS